MEGSPRAPERRFPQAVRELQDDAVRVEFAVALALVLSIAALVYAMTVVDSFAEVVRVFADRARAG
jgi:hypothetical protein